MCPAEFELLMRLLLSPLRPLAHGRWSSRNSKLLATGKIRWKKDLDWSVLEYDPSRKSLLPYRSRHFTN